MARNEALLKLAAERGVTSPDRIAPASSISIRPGASPPPSCATCRPAPRPGRQRARLHLAVGRARRGIHRQGQCPRPAAHLGRLGRQRRASRRRGLSCLAGRAAGDRRGAALCRIDRGPRALPRGWRAQVAAKKPVIALFGGRTPVGGRAAAAHTGAVANDDAAIEAFCASCGIIRVESLRRLLVAAKAFGRFPQGLGTRALILSNSGGPGVLCADRAALEGLELGALPQRDGRRAAPAAAARSLGRQPDRPAWPTPARTVSAWLSRRP